MGLEAKEWWLDVPNARLPVWDIELGDRAGGLSVVFLHGWGRSRVDSLGRIAPFLEQAERIVLIDLRGHGEASGRTNLGDGEERDIAQLVERLPDGPVLLVGHSLGATIAIAAASLAPRVLGVIAMAPYDTVRTPLRSRLVVRDLPAGLCVTLALLVLRAFGAQQYSTIDAARRLRCPLLVLHGANDRIVPVAEAEAIARAGKGEFVLVADAEHADIEQREDYARACLAFASRDRG
jgi:uncharacterized protein